MKKLLNLLFTTLFIISMMMTYSCKKDFLIKEPPGVASASQMNTKDGVEALLVGTYQATKGDRQVWRSHGNRLDLCKRRFR